MLDEHLDTDLARAVAEVAAAVGSVSPETLDAVAADVAAASTVASYAGGREGLVMKGLTMRLFHAGVDAHSIGEMTCPAVGSGDLVILSCGPGNISTVEALAGRAKDAGARLMYFTAAPDQPPANLADRVVVIAAQTMSSDSDSPAVLPMGSGYEIALFVLVDLITHRIRNLRHESPELMRSRHTNLE